MNPNPKQAFGDKKPALDELPLVALIEACLALFDGDGKYGFRNWRENPVEARTYIKAALRHLGLWAEGEEHARDTGVNNLGAVMACCAILLDAQANGTLIDNRSKSQAAADRLHDAEADVARIKKTHEDRLAQRAVEGSAPYGWVCFNEGPGGWFWCATREECEHELTDFDTIRPATQMEKSLWDMARDPKTVDPAPVDIIRDEVSGDWEPDLGHVASPTVDSVYPKPSALSGAYEENMMPGPSGN